MIGRATRPPDAGKSPSPIPAAPSPLRRPVRLGLYTYRLHDAAKATAKNHVSSDGDDAGRRMHHPPDLSSEWHKPSAFCPETTVVIYGVTWRLPAALFRVTNPMRT